MRRLRRLSFLAVLLLITASVCQVAPPAAARLELADGTPLKLRLTRNVSSADAKLGEQIDFEVLEEVRVGELIAVPKGSVAWGTVTEVQSKRLARNGKVNITIDSVRLASGQKTALRAAPITAASPSGLSSIYGKDVSIAKGTEITAYINGKFDIDHAKFAPPKEKETSSPTAEHGDPAPQHGAASLSSVLVSSTPPGAEIELDDSFVGSTPSVISMSLGEHRVLIRKKGYRNWERKIKATIGSIKIDAELEAEK